MKPQSAKAKGRRLQQYLRNILIEAATHFGVTSEDIRSTSMGASGEDILLSTLARKIYPFSFECKNAERINIWKAIEQAKGNGADHQPAVVFKKNGEDPYIAIPLDSFAIMASQSYAVREAITKTIEEATFRES